jgi:hypothetical protein
MILAVAHRLHDRVLLPLQLVTSRAFPSGILELVYAPRR